MYVWGLIKLYNHINLLIYALYEFNSELNSLNNSKSLSLLDCLSTSFTLLTLVYVNTSNFLLELCHNLKMNTVLFTFVNWALISQHFFKNSFQK